MKIRPLIKIHGGKSHVSRFLIPFLPKDFHNLEFYDLFGGGGNFLLQCPKAKKENYKYM